MVEGHVQEGYTYHELICRPNDITAYQIDLGKDECACVM